MGTALAWTKMNIKNDELPNRVSDSMSQSEPRNELKEQQADGGSNKFDIYQKQPLFCGTQVLKLFKRLQHQPDGFMNSVQLKTCN